MLVDWAEMMQIECVRINKDTTVESFKQEIFLSDLRLETQVVKTVDGLSKQAHFEASAFSFMFFLFPPRGAGGSRPARPAKADKRSPPDNTRAKRASYATQEPDSVFLVGFFSTAAGELNHVFWRNNPPGRNKTRNPRIWRAETASSEKNPTLNKKITYWLARKKGE